MTKPRKNPFKNKRFKKYFFIALSILFLVGLWWILSATQMFSRAGIIPSPPTAIIQMGRAAGTSALWLNVWNTVWKVLVAFSIAFVTAFALAILAALRSEVEYFLSPIMTFLRALPVMGIVLIFIVAIRRPEVTAILIGFLMVFPVMYQNLLTAIKETDKKLLQMAKVHKVPFARQVISIYAPHMAPHIVSTCVASIGMAFKVVIAAEIIGIPTANTLGTAMFQASQSILHLGYVFMWLMVAVIVNFILEGVIKLIGYFSMPWLRKSGKCCSEGENCKHKRGEGLGTRGESEEMREYALSASAHSDRSSLENNAEEESNDNNN